MVDIVDPRVYAAKSRSNDPGAPSFFQDVHGEFVEQYLEDMKSEIQSLITQSTWATFYPSEATRLIKSDWGFKLKQFPYGTVSKFKAQFCVRGDLQKAGVEYFET
jgi:hypothetical protein